MAFEKCVYVFLISSCLFGLLRSEDIIVSPKIDFPHLEHTLESGSNFSIFCEGNSKLSWETPSVTNEKHKIYSTYTTFTIKHLMPRHSGYRYASELHITNISFPFVGFYTCKEERFLRNPRSSQLYLYVNDEEHLSVEEKDLDSIVVTQYSVAVIPCRPTFSDVSVNLTRVSGDEVKMDVLYEDNTMFQYDPRYGFFTNATNQVEMTFFRCYFKRGERSFDYPILMEKEIVTDSLAQPFIEEVNKKLHNVVGDTVELKCMIKSQVHTTISWETPHGEIDEKRMSISPLLRDPDFLEMYYRILTIKDVTLRDRGRYMCHASDNQNHSNENYIDLAVYDSDDHFIRLAEENRSYQISAEAGTPSVQWNIDIDAHPEPNITWLNNKNELIPLGISNKYETRVSAVNAFLLIKDITITDFGNYTLLAQNKYDTEPLILFLNVTDKPTIELSSDKEFQMINEKTTVTCTVAAYPEPLIYWEFKPCLTDTCEYIGLNSTDYHRNGLKFISNITLQVQQSGVIRCMANNSKGEDVKEIGLHVSDVENGFGIFGLDEDVVYDKEGHNATVAIGDSVSFTCGAYIQNFSQEIEWRRGSGEDISNHKFTLQKSHTLFSNRSMLTIHNMTHEEEGVYICILYKIEGETKEEIRRQNISFLVKRSTAPSLRTCNLNDTVEVSYGTKLELVCDFEGLPKPMITWYKNNEVLQLFEPRMMFEEDTKKLIFANTIPQDEGTYRCEGKNVLGSQSREMVLSFNNKFGSKWYILVIVVLLFSVFLACIIIYIKDKRKKKLEKVLIEAGLANFEKGQLENLNPELGIDDQAELLPYDKKWEFPIQNLKLGKQLGAGAFGVVMKGEARGILEDESVTTVAVKMVKRNAEHTYVKALASELKIMVHLGKHLNVVNLLGACTKNVAKRELLVIVEYCKFGNLHNFLYRHRDNYINQVDPQTGQIDFTIGQDILERSYSLASSKSAYPMKYAALSFRSSSGKSNQESRRDSEICSTAKTESTIVSMSPNTDQVSGEEMITSSSSNNVQPEWRSNYRADYKGTVKPIATKDLLAWAFQVARGMEYLASRKVLHGDLAARNILLTDDNIVKICDFGLAKSMYKTDNYKKNSDGPLPVKWMAVESIRDRICILPNIIHVHFFAGLIFLTTFPNCFLVLGEKKSPSATARKNNTKIKMGEVDPAFENAGQNAGLEIWRIEDFKPTPYPKDQYGKFYEGDSYIVLSTKIFNNGAKEWNLHYWLGSKTSQDEAGAAAVLTVQLDESLGGVPVQYREVQDHESQLFLSYFKNGVRYLPGGVSSGFHHVDPDAFEKKLYQVKGSRNVRVKQVDPNISSMNTGDCFILDVGKNIYVYVGVKSRRIERLKAITAANQIRDDDHAGHSKVEIIDESSTDAEREEFFQILGSGSPSEVPSDTEAGDDQKFESNQERTASLYRVSDASGGLEVEAVGEKPFSRSALDTNDCFILDTVDSNIFIWIGKKCNGVEKANVMKIAENYLKSKNYPPWTQVQRIVEEAEPTVFTQYFKSWDAQKPMRGRLVREASTEEQEGWEARLFHASINRNKSHFDIDQIFDFEQEDLYSDDIMILDLGTKVYLWIGKQASDQEISQGADLVKAYLRKFGRDEVEVVKINQEEEDEKFKKQFPSWNDDFWST